MPICGLAELDSLDFPNRVKSESKVAEVVSHAELSLGELYATLLLINYAIHDHKFFDWEMPTLTGLTAEEFGAVSDKLPRE